MLINDRMLHFMHLSGQLNISQKKLDTFYKYIYNFVEIMHSLNE